MCNHRESPPGKLFDRESLPGTLFDGWDPNNGYVTHGDCGETWMVLHFGSRERRLLPTK